MTKRTVAIWVSWLWGQLARHRQRSDWVLLGAIIACLGIFLLYVNSLTPHQPKVEQPLFYEVDSSSEYDPSFRKMRITSVSEDGIAQGELLDGTQKGMSVSVNIGAQTVSTITEGDTIFAAERTTNEGMREFSYIGKFRLPALGVLFAIFIVLVVLIGGKRGAASIVGLILSILVIGWFVIPFIVNGHNVLLITMIGAYIIAVFSVLIAHGPKKRTYIAIGCILAVLTFVALLAWIATWFISLTGLADELSFYLSLNKSYLDMRGILISGIVIASLGVLDDIVTTQVATVEELHKANQAWGRTRLFMSASSVGGEHIASLVNTLALAYVGASLPFIIMLWGQSYSPIMTLNGEYIATEIVRTLVASIGLVIAIPVSTLTAVLLYASSRFKGRRE